MNISVDTSRAGPGDIEVTVKAGNDVVPCKMVPHRIQRQCFKVYFIPREPVRHFIFVSFGTEAVTGTSRHPRLGEISSH